MGRPAIDISGQKFGKLTALSIVEHCGAHKPARWLCMCECGNQKVVDSQLLRRGIVKDCGCRIKNRLVGEKFGRLTVLHPTKNRFSGCGDIVWECKCDCGNICYVATCNFIAKRSKTISCGCNRREQSTTHGYSETRLYKCWTAIKQRCFNEKSQNYSRYGGRGITVCNEWLSFETFMNWALNNGYSPDLSIDRIDNNGNYEPSNCRWVDMSVQANNKRSNRYIEIDGVTKTLTQWAKERGMRPALISHRISCGWSEADAVLTPPRHRSNPKKTLDNI